MADLQKICLDKHWCHLLADRWKVSPVTVRRWTQLGLLGVVHRRNLQSIRLSSIAVLEFEKRYADVLSVGNQVFNLRQVANRYGVTPRAIQMWRKKHRFPEPDRVPTSILLRWRLTTLERFEAAYGLIPVSKAALAEVYNEP